MENELKVCVWHGRLWQYGHYVQLTLRGNDLRSALEFLGAEVKDTICDECANKVQQYLNQPRLFREGV